MSIRATATVRDRGRVTIPTAVRDYLGDIRFVEFKVTGNIITLRAIPDVSGSLSKYATDSLTKKLIYGHN